VLLQQLLVITGLVPVIHAFLSFASEKTWMAGTSPAMTAQICYLNPSSSHP
jgi:hypothetical protein